MYLTISHFIISLIHPRFRRVVPVVTEGWWQLPKLLKLTSAPSTSYTQGRNTGQREYGDFTILSSVNDEDVEL
jgi:hypothetical protein